MDTARFRWLFVAILLILGFFSRPILASPPLPSWGEIESAFNSHFSSLPGHVAGGIITREEAEPLWDKLAKLGWQVKDREAIAAKIPSGGDFLVRQLRSETGARFTRQVAAKQPAVYDRLDRLAQVSGGGHNAVSGLIGRSDAAQTIAYMLTPAGGRSWAIMLGKQKATFTQPTGRIYTAEQFQMELKNAFANK